MQSSDTSLSQASERLELLGNGHAESAWYFEEAASVKTLRQAAKVMIVDDAPLNIKIVKKYLKVAGYSNFLTSIDPRPVLEMILQQVPDVILLDVTMPGISGLEILRAVRKNKNSAHIPVIILTASDTKEIRIEALHSGATDFLTKPVDAAELVPRVQNALIVKAHHDHLKNYSQELKAEVRKRTAELAASRLELIHCLARTAEFRDNDTGRHVVRVGRYAEIIARQLGANEEFIELIAHAAPLHDMGKVGIPDRILLKREKLAPEEFEIIKKHTVYGHHTFESIPDEETHAIRAHTFMGEMIMDVASSPIITMAAKIALTHHEKWDGTGYPMGLKGEEIPLAGRITAVADVFDALGSVRPYKPAFSLDRCFEIVEGGRGTHFDPKVLDAFLACRERIAQVYTELRDLDDASPPLNQPPVE